MKNLLFFFVGILFFACSFEDQKSPRENTKLTKEKVSISIKDKTQMNIPENCATDQSIKFLGDVSRSASYIIGTTHLFENETNYIGGYLYDNEGLIYQAFKQIHELEGSDIPLVLYVEGLGEDVSVSDTKILQKLIPQCVIDMGYNTAIGVDTREKGESFSFIVEKFPKVFSEYYKENKSSDGKVIGYFAQKKLSTEDSLWLRNVWYPKIITTDIIFEKNIISKMNSNKKNIIICGVKHVFRMGNSRNIDWAIIAVDNYEESIEFRRALDEQSAKEWYVCVVVLGLPYFP